MDELFSLLASQLVLIGGNAFVFSYASIFNWPHDDCSKWYNSPYSL